MPHIPGDPEAGHRNIRPGGGGNVRPGGTDNVRPSEGNVRPSPGNVRPTQQVAVPPSDDVPRLGGIRGFLQSRPRSIGEALSRSPVVIAGKGVLDALQLITDPFGEALASFGETRTSNIGRNAPDSPRILGVPLFNTDISSVVGEFRALPVSQAEALLNQRITESAISPEQAQKEMKDLVERRVSLVRSQESQVLIGNFLSGDGDLSGPQLAGALRENFQERPFIEQLGIGIIADPTGLLPVGAAIKGTRAGVQGIRGAQQARRLQSLRNIPAPAQAVTRDISQVFPGGVESKVGDVPNILTSVQDSVARGRTPAILQGTAAVDSAGKPKRLFHGTQSIFETFDPSRTNANALYGPGAYFTDSPSVAAGYAKPSRGAFISSVNPPSDNIHPVFINVKKTLDIDASAHPDVVSAISGMLDEGDAIARRGNLATIEAGLDRIVDKLPDGLLDRAGAPVSRPQTRGLTSEILSTELSKLKNDDLYRMLEGMFGDRAEVNDWIASNGFEAITHIGGARTGTPPHRVWIVLPDDNFSVENRIFSAFEQAIPSLGGRRSLQGAGQRPPDKITRPIQGTNQNVEFTPPPRVRNVRPVEPLSPLTQAESAEEVKRLGFEEFRRRKQFGTLESLRAERIAKVQEANITIPSKSRKPGKTPNTAREAATEKVDRRLAAQDRAGKSPLVARAIQAIKDTKIVRRATTELISEQRPARVARGIAASEGGPVRTQSRRFFGAQRGEFEAFEPDDAISKLFTEGEFDELVGMIRDPDIFNPVSQAFQMNTADRAFQKLFDENLLPTEGEIALLDEVFGGRFVRAALSNRKLGRKIWSGFLDIWNLPRAFIASGDLSGTLRQAGMLAAGNPKRFGQANAAQFRAAISKRGFLIEKELIESNPNFQRFTRKPSASGRGTQTRLQLTSTSGSSPLNAREEVYLSGFSDNIPIIRQSQRAFVTLLNKLRMDVMDDMVGLIEDGGRVATETQLDDIARFINNATGRGPLPVPQDVAAIFNGVFFSSRLFTSRIALPFSVISRSGTIRAKVAKDLVKAVGTIMTMEMALKYSGAAEVESDPRSSDFGKMKFGKVRIDPWMGFQQIARLVAQLATGERKAVGTGSISEVDYFETVARFLRSKLHPSAGAVYSLVDGEDFLGDDFLASFQQPFLGEGVQSPSDLLDIRKNPVFSNLVFLFTQDMLDAIAEQGFVSGLGVGAATFFGEGASIFTSQDDIARDIHGVGFTEIYPFEQTEVRAIFNAQEDDTPEILEGGRINPDLSRSRQLDIERMNKLTELAALAGGSRRFTTFGRGGQGNIVRDYFSIKAENAIRKNEARENLFGDTDYQQDSRGTPLEKTALQEYYNAIDESKSPAGIFLNDVWQQKREELTNKWRGEGTLLYVQANTNTKPVPKRLEDFLRTRSRNEWQRLQDSKDAREKLSARSRSFTPTPNNTSTDVPVRPTSNVRPTNPRSNNVRP